MLQPKIYVKDKNKVYDVQVNVRILDCLMKLISWKIQD